MLKQVEYTKKLMMTNFYLNFTIIFFVGDSSAGKCGSIFCFWIFLCDELKLLGSNGFLNLISTFEKFHIIGLSKLVSLTIKVNS